MKFSTKLNVDNKNNKSKKVINSKLVIKIKFF